MKKIIAVTLAILMLLALAACGSSPAEPAPAAEAPAPAEEPAEEAPAEDSPAEEPPAEPAAYPPLKETDNGKVTVTISAAGELVAVNASVGIGDYDHDGAFTLNDVLIAAHEALFEGGADGYICEKSDYGMSICKLWGIDNGGGYGYYINDQFVNSPLDPVTDGDSVYAYTYADLTNWSDIYCWFEVAKLTDKGIELQLMSYVYDANWVMQTLPVEGAHILLNGEDTGIVTDSEGCAVLPVPENGGVVSAFSDTQTLTPPAFSFMG